MFDRLRSKETATISAVFALSLGVTACGGGGNSTEAAPAPIIQHKGTTEVTYNKDGSVTVIPPGNYSELEEFCQGTMLVTETFSTGYYGSSVSTQPDSPYCADGKLTPGDFQPDLSK